MATKPARSLLRSTWNASPRRASAWLCVLALSLPACQTSSAGDWERARREDTIEAYRAFLYAHPKAAEAPLAIERNWELLFVREPTLETCRAYLKQFPQGPQAEKAREILRPLEAQARAQEEESRARAERDHRARVSRLRGYEAGVLTEARFGGDDWFDPNPGTIGVIGWKRTTSGSTRKTRFVLGYMKVVPQSLPRDWRATVRFMMSSTDDGEAKLEGGQTRVATLDFVDGVLTKLTHFD